MIRRTLEGKLKQAARKFPVVAVTGPRQSGKTTLVRAAFPRRAYVSLEYPDTRDFARSDPRGFLNRYATGAILDEIQRAPELLSYIQGMVDEHPAPGRFILTGSHHFLLMEKLSQSLAGRIRILTLLPPALDELAGTVYAPRSVNDAVWKGFYPRVLAQRISPRDWYPDYIQMYIARDVRLVKNIGNLEAFQKFVKLCASRTGQLLNLSSLAMECGITHNTAKSWISVLQAGFVVFLLRPHHRNFNKRLVKSPKLYFYDTGLACSLLGIETHKQVGSHPLRGSLFETLILSELAKQRHHRGLPVNLYFWRDKTGHEIDCLIDKGGVLVPAEIKSGETVTKDAFTGLNYWSRLTRHAANSPSYLIYAGLESQRRSRVEVLPWTRLKGLV